MGHGHDVRRSPAGIGLYVKPQTLSEFSKASGGHNADSLRELCKPAGVIMPTGDTEKISVTRALIEKFGSRAGYLYISEWGIFPSSEKRAEVVAFCSRHNLPLGPPDLRVVSFSKTEFVQMAELFILASRSIWDVFLVDSKAKRILFISHDEIAYATFTATYFR